MDYQTSSDGDGSKRLSSIKSILNPTLGSREDTPDPIRLSPMRSPSTTTSLPSPGVAYSHTPPTALSTPVAPPNFHGEADRLKAEKRAALEREADKMREMLAAKERELAEL